MHSAGVTITVPGGEVISRAVLICCTCDMPAKAQVLNVVQYNGFYGCPCCLQKGWHQALDCFLLLLVIVSGETVRTGSRGRVHSFPYLSKDPVGPTRTDEETREHAKQAHLEGSPVCIEHTWCFLWHMTHDGQSYMLFRCLESRDHLSSLLFPSLILFAE